MRPLWAYRECPLSIREISSRAVSPSPVKTERCLRTLWGPLSGRATPPNPYNTSRGQGESEWGSEDMGPPVPGSERRQVLTMSAELTAGFQWNCNHELPGPLCCRKKEGSGGWGGGTGEGTRTLPDADGLPVFQTRIPEFNRLGFRSCPASSPLLLPCCFTSLGKGVEYCLPPSGKAWALHGPVVSAQQMPAP